MENEFLSAFTEQNLPHSLEAEQSVLGAVLLDQSCISQILEYVKTDCFFKPIHQEIFSVMLRMFTAGDFIDIISVMDACLQEGVFDTEENAKIYLTNLAQTVPSLSNLATYAKIVQEKFYMRSLIFAAQDIIKTAAEGTTAAPELLDQAEQKIFDIRQGKDATELRRIDEVIVEAYDRLQKLSGDDKDEFVAAPSGFRDLDTIITGLNKSDLILVAARPGMGKTAFALNIATNVAKKTNKDVAIFNLEMSAEQLVTRMLSSESGIDSKNLRTGQLGAEDWVKLAAAAQTLAKAPIYIDDSTGLNVAQMKARLRKRKNLGLVVIDYLQLMSSGRRIDNRVQEVSEITRNLKIMAKELKVPVITLSQLSRGPESRADHRPNLADLRESGSIEQDADIVMFLYREAYYEKESEQQNLAECIVGKNRHGETGTVELSWDGTHTRYTSLERIRNE